MCTPRRHRLNIFDPYTLNHSHSRADAGRGRATAPSVDEPATGRKRATGLDAFVVTTRPDTEAISQSQG